MGELIKRQDAINAVMQNYCYESDQWVRLSDVEEAINKYLN